MSAPRSPAGFLASCRRHGIPRATARDILAKQEANLARWYQDLATFDEVNRANKALVRRALSLRDMRKAEAS